MSKYLCESGKMKETIVAPSPRQAAVDLVTLASLDGPQVLGLLIAVTGPDGEPIYFATDNARREAYPPDSFWN